MVLLFGGESGGTKGLSLPFGEPGQGSPGVIVIIVVRTMGWKKQERK